MLPGAATHVLLEWQAAPPSLFGKGRVPEGVLGEEPMGTSKVPIGHTGPELPSALPNPHYVELPPADASAASVSDRSTTTAGITGIPSDLLVAVRARLCNEVGAGPAGPWSAPCYTLGPPTAPPTEVGLFAAAGLSDDSDALAAAQLHEFATQMSAIDLLALGLAGAIGQDGTLAVPKEAARRSLALHSKLRGRPSAGDGVASGGLTSWPVTIKLPHRDRAHHAAPLRSMEVRWRTAQQEEVDGWEPQVAQGRGAPAGDAKVDGGTEPKPTFGTEWSEFNMDIGRTEQEPDRSVVECWLERVPTTAPGLVVTARLCNAVGQSRWLPERYGRIRMPTMRQTSQA